MRARPANVAVVVAPLIVLWMGVATHQWFVEDEWDNIAAAREVFRPYLIIHGAIDDFIQPSNAEQVYEFANEPKKLWLVPGANHSDSDEVAPEDYADHISCWVDQSCVQ